MSKIVFATTNLTAIAVFQLEETAEQLYNLGIRAYPIAIRLPDPQEDIISASFYAPIFDDRVMRRSIGKFAGAVQSIKADTGFFKSYFAFKHTCNYNYDGSVVFNRDFEIIGTSTIIDTEFNFANHVIQLGGCFDANGVWDFNAKGCLREWKHLMLSKYGFELPGTEDACLDERCIELIPENLRDDATAALNANSNLVARILELNGVEDDGYIA